MPAPFTFGDLTIAEDTWLPLDNPLDNLYVPLLRRARRYDRMSWYFSDSALVAAASGLAHFVAHGGVMRLLMGNQVTEEFLAAQGLTLSEHLSDLIFSDPDEAGAQVFKSHARETLGWLIAKERLVIRVCTPRSAVLGYFHSKLLLLDDGEGHELAISGSVNESETGWKANYEHLTIQDSSASLAKWKTTFETLWEGRDPAWKTHDLPEAVASRLIEVAPLEPPGALVGMDVIDATAGGGGTDVGETTATLGPIVRNALPLLFHQTQALDAITSHWGRSYLIADEVGLGKTIEIGAALRWGIENRKVKRALVLVPASVLEQWQGELLEKVGLLIPRYEGGKLLYPNDQPLRPSANPWAEERFLLASSQLARTKRHRGLLLEAAPWDLVALDEAHHARLHDQGGRTLLLRLMDEMVAKERIGVLLGATATPIQTDRRELFGLMRLLKLPGGWSNEANFAVFYEALELFTNDPNAVSDEAIGLLHRLSRAYAADAPLPMGVDFGIEMFLDGPIASPTVRSLPREERKELVVELRRRSPLGQNFIRETRERLRQYKRGGIAFVDVNIPTRQIEDRFIRLTPNEENLYAAIDDYIRRRFESYAKERKTRGMGFLMTVYRRRLTSSFAAISASLSRRLARLDALDADDAREVEGDEDEYDTLFQDGVAESADRASEDEDIRQFLANIASEVVRDTKTQVLVDELRRAEAEYPSVVIFTIYSDTMYWLRSQLIEEFMLLSKEYTIGCYSGAGGEIYDPVTRSWEMVDKAHIVEELRSGRLRFLIGTDAMSEGLNLQWCGKLINFDMPWNLMRVEQRIGRLDRIGASHQTISVTNYFIEDTVEANIYKKLVANYGDVNSLFRIAPIIAAQVEKITASAVFRPGAEIDRDVDQIRLPSIPWE